MPPSTLNLPERVFVLITRDPGAGEGQVSVIKATNPHGQIVPIAFTQRTFADHFARTVGLARNGQDVGVMEMEAGALLEELAAANEPSLHIDPLQSTEAILNYTRPGTLRRQNAEDAVDVEVRKPTAPMEAEHVALLRTVAATLPAVERIWLMEVVHRDEGGETRPLIVVQQNLAQEDEGYQGVFMELGDQWCDALPPGIAVDMVPHDTPVVREALDDACVVYTRDPAVK